MLAGARPRGDFREIYLAEDIPGNIVGGEKNKKKINKKIIERVAAMRTRQLHFCLLAKVCEKLDLRWLDVMLSVCCCLETRSKKCRVKSVRVG